MRLALYAALGLVALVVLGWCQSANAQQQPGGRIGGPVGRVLDAAGVKPPAEAIHDRVQSALAKPFQDLADLLNSDIDEAIRLSTAIPDLQDGNGKACWTVLQSASKVFKEHPVPATLKLATDIQAFRLLHMTANRLCTNAACTQVFQDGANIVQSLGLGIPVPSLASLCAKIPVIAIAPATP